MPNNYWTTALSQRISRRRSLAAAGGTALAAGFLAACGGGSKSTKNTPEQNQGLLIKPVDTFKQAKRGGIIKDRTHADVTSLDSALSSVTVQRHRLAHPELAARAAAGLSPEPTGH